MNSFCPYCLKPSESYKLHKDCNLSFFGDSLPREMPFSRDQLLKLTENPSIIPIGERIDYLRPEKRILSPGADDHSYTLNTSLTLDDSLRLQLGYLITRAFQLETKPSTLVMVKSGEIALLRATTVPSQSQDSVETKLEAFTNLEKDIVRKCDYYGEELLRLFEYALACFLCGSDSFEYNSFNLETSERDYRKISPISQIHLAFKEWKDFTRERLFDLAKYFRLPSTALENAIKKLIVSQYEVIDIITASPLKKEAQMIQIELLKSRISRIRS